MSETACLLVDADGIIKRANPAARHLLGSCVGHPCHRVVHLRDQQGCSNCTRTCAWFLTALQAPRQAHGDIRGAIPAVVSCSPLGDDVVVILRPENEPRDDATLPSWLPRTIAASADIPAVAVPWRPAASG